MFKITAVLSLMLIAFWSQADSSRQKEEIAYDSEPFASGSALWADGLSCDSCGSECASACGTRHFRSCCFNYLRRKRGPDNHKMWQPAQTIKMKAEDRYQNKIPFVMVESLPEHWAYNLIPTDIEPYNIEDTVDIRPQMYEI